MTILTTLDGTLAPGIGFAGGGGEEGEKYPFSPKRGFPSPWDLYISETRETSGVAFAGNKLEGVF